MLQRIHGGADNGTGGDAIVWNSNTSESAGNTATNSIGGAGANGVFNVGSTNITANGGVGGGVGATPITTMRLVVSGGSFAIAGMPVARHALTTDLGISFGLAKNVGVDASYLGQLASKVQDQGARMSLNVTS